MHDLPGKESHEMMAGIPSRNGLEQLVKLLADAYSFAQHLPFNTPSNFKKPFLHPV